MMLYVCMYAACKLVHTLFVFVCAVSLGVRYLVLCFANKRATSLPGDDKMERSRISQCASKDSSHTLYNVYVYSIHKTSISSLYNIGPKIEFAPCRDKHHQLTFFILYFFLFFTHDTDCEYVEEVMNTFKDSRFSSFKLKAFNRINATKKVYQQYQRSVKGLC